MREAFLSPHKLANTSVPDSSAPLSERLSALTLTVDLFRTTARPSAVLDRLLNNPTCHVWHGLGNAEALAADVDPRSRYVDFVGQPRR